MAPKWNQNQCHNSSKINAKTGTKRFHGNHETSCFSGRLKAEF